MIDFVNGTFVKLRKVSVDDVMKSIEPLLIDGEIVVGAYKGIRDFCVFTDKRIISVNVQGMTGKKKDFTSMPYSKISVYSVETAGVFDLDAELEMYFSGVGKVKFEFIGTNDVVAIGKLISAYALK